MEVHVYIDELLTRLRQSRIGCHIGHIYVGAAAYADDVTLLAPTRQGIVSLLKISNDFSCEYDVKFNPDKSRLLVFNNDMGDCDLKDIVFNDKVNKVSPKEYHLGNSIGCESLYEMIKHCTNNFITKVNITLSQFKHAFSDIKYNLFKTYCMPLYSSQLWDYSHKSIDIFFTTWRKCIRRVWSLPHRTHNVLLNLICSDFSVDTQLHKRFMKFFNHVINSENNCIRICGRLAMHGSRSNVCNSLNYICSKYNLDKYKVTGLNCNVILNKMNMFDVRCRDNKFFQIAGMIRDTVLMRDSKSDPQFSYEELHYN
jgi:hypothetical protein